MENARSASLLAEGEKLGSYRVVRLIGKGGMGEVYEVEQIRLGIRYALKAFPVDGTNGAFLTKRFIAEGRILARLNHPRIVRVYDMDVTDRFAWFTMDYVEAPEGCPGTLADAPQAGAVPEATLAGWYEDLREALAVVHGAGIVHRDVKLENILVGRDGRAVLSDFGISRIVDDRLRNEIAVTRTVSSADVPLKTVLGTVAYLAPEVRAGGVPTAAGDLYALGVAFFRLLTGLWYEPGPHAFDLLAPFDRRWRVILGALLEADPARRRADAFRPARKWTPGFVKGLVAASLALALAAAGLAAYRRGWVSSFRSEEGQSRDMAFSDEFSIPESVR